MNNSKLFTADEINSFNIEFSDIGEDTIEDLVVPFEEMSQELQEEEWEFQNSDNWIAEYEEAQAEKDMPVIEHWFYYEHTVGGETVNLVRGIHKESQQIITTSRVVDVTNDVLITGSGSTYKLVHKIANAENDAASDICKYWPMYKGC